MRKALIALAALIVSAAIVVPEADAARLGGGRSVGTQRSVTRTPPASTPAKPAQQAAPAGQQQAAPAQPAPAAQPSFMQKWGPLLGGLAIGGLLGSLFSGNGLGGILLLVLLALAAFVVIRVLMQRRAPQERPMQYAGFQERGLPPEPARMAAAPQAGVNAPAGFDTAAFLKGARMNFMKLQAANDAGNVEDLREFTTSEMLESLARDVEARGGAKQQTDVAQLDAELLEVVTERDRHWASVRFSGLVREAPGAAAEPFEEVWNLVKPADGSTGWLLAGIQQMN